MTAMKTVHIVPDVYDKNSWATLHTENVLESLTERWEKLPANTRIYHKSIALTTDVTPDATADSIRKFMALEGEFFVVINPSLAPLAIVAIVSAVLSVGLSLYTMLTMPKVKKTQAQSPNNELQARQNVARYKGRVPCIYGTVWAYPDLISQTYTYFLDDGVEVERQLLCIGEGEYSILEVREALTNVVDIPDTSISIYNPNDLIIGTPVWRSGRAFSDAPLEVIHSNSITGQTLDAAETNLIETNEVYFTAQGEVIRRGNFSSVAVDFVRAGIEVGETISLDAQISTLKQSYTTDITITPDEEIRFIATHFDGYDQYRRVELGDFSRPIQVMRNNVVETQVLNFAGRYLVRSIYRTPLLDNNGRFEYFITLDHPEEYNTAWVEFTARNSGTSNGFLNTSQQSNTQITLSNHSSDINLSGTYEVLEVSSSRMLLSITHEAAKWAGFGVDTQAFNTTVYIDELSSKWVGWHEIYQSQAQQIVFNIHFPQGLFRQNSKGGTSEDYTSFQIQWHYIDENGDAAGDIRYVEREIRGKTRSSFGRTERIHLTPLYAGVRFRIARLRKNIANNVSATMNIKNVYLAKPNNKLRYPWVTVVQSEAKGNDGLYALKERKLNILVQRKVLEYGTGDLIATNSADHILINAALDPNIGRRSLDEVDVQQIVAEITAVKEYFGEDAAADFCGTLDNPSLSFEETAGMIASAAFCEPTRIASKLRLNFERPQQHAVLLFNHRNKIPKSEVRTYSLSREREYDGVELEYTDPRDDIRTSVMVPNNTITNAMKINSTGIRNHNQAKTRAWREWLKILYQRVSVEFEALEEAQLLAKHDMIMVTDNTMKSRGMDGDVRYVRGLTMGLSQDVQFSGTASVYLQMSNGQVDIVGCRMGPNAGEILLNRPPICDLVTDSRINTVYEIVLPSGKADLFLLSDARPANQNQILTAYNYDERYYEKDHAFFVNATPGIQVTIDILLTSSNNRPTLSGTGEVGRTVTVTLFNEYDEIIGTLSAVVDGLGEWRAQSEPLMVGAYNASAMMTNSRGQVTTAATAFTIDRQRVAVTLQDIPPSEDKRPQIAGRGDLNATIVVTITDVNDVIVATLSTTAGPLNTWIVMVASDLDVGMYVVHAVQTDTANTQTSATTMLEIQAPAAVPNEVTVGSILTSTDPTPTIMGMGEPSATVRVLIYRTSSNTLITTQTTVVDQFDLWELELTTALTADTYTVRVEQTLAGQSQASSFAETSMVIERVPTLVTINSIPSSSNTMPVFSGTGEPSASVSLLVTDSNNSTILSTGVVVNAQGVWQITGTSLAVGTYTATVTQNVNNHSSNASTTFEIEPTGALQAPTDLAASSGASSYPPFDLRAD